MTERTETQTLEDRITTACARGCTLARRHVTDCEDQDSCRGCLPKKAEHGRLCRDCHRRLIQWIDLAPAQVELLNAVVGKVLPGALPDVVETNARIVTMWRTDSGQDFPSQLFARATPIAYAESEPIRTEALDLARDIEDWLSVQVEMLVEAHDMAGPSAARRPADQGQRRMMFTDPSRPEYGPTAVWHDPPPRFVLAPACRWLAAQISRLEAVDHIADLWEELGERMSLAHSMAPWRAQSSSLDGICCPRCQRMSLVLYGGDDFVTCTTGWCESTFEWERYAIWARMLADERQGA